MQDDTTWALQNVSAQSSMSLSSRMLDICTRGHLSERKTFERRCISTRTGGYVGAVHLQYVPPDNGYIAISCPWQLSCPKEKDDTIYSCDRPVDIGDLHPTLRIRVVKLATAFGLPFWLDKLCINQSGDSSEKELAIQSMDLVYKESKWSAGLLFISLDCETQVHLLGGLLSGEFVQDLKKEDGGHMYRLLISEEDALQVLILVELITSDIWWERAWIFQEEYLSGKHMLLLVRSRVPFKDKRFTDRDVPNVPGELIFPAIKFCKQVTCFCIAYTQLDSETSARHVENLTNVLDKVRKYNVILPYNTQKMKNWQAMSSIIIADIGRRQITIPFDILAIAANSCDYSERISSKSLEESLSLAIFTMYILNGEIICSNPENMANYTSNIFEYLQHNALQIEPPLKGKELTFIKHCRFPEVYLTQYGVETKGIIWKLGKEIPPSPELRKAIWLGMENMHRRRRGHWHSGKRNQLSDFEYSNLRVLVHWLRKGMSYSYIELADKLENFLQDIAPKGYEEDWSWRHIMNIMAKSIASALREGRWLLLGSIYRGGDYSPYAAIFIDKRDSEDISAPKHFAFTSWVSAREVVDGAFLETSCAKYASLDIEYSEPCEMRTRGWMNGLCFFSYRDAQDVLIPWRLITGA